MPEQLCIRCNKYPPFKHPSTGKMYKLCAAYGLKAMAQLLNIELDEHYNFKPVVVAMRDR